MSQEQLAPAAAAMAALKQKDPNKLQHISKHGCGLDMSVLGIKVKHDEASRAGRVICINNRMPDARLNLLKSEQERREEVLTRKANQKEIITRHQSHYDVREKEFNDLLNKIHKVKQVKQAEAMNPTNKEDVSDGLAVRDGD